MSSWCWTSVGASARTRIVPGPDRAAITALGPVEYVHPKDRLELSVEVQGVSERLAKGETNGRVGKVTAAAPRGGRG